MGGWEGGVGGGVGGGESVRPRVWLTQPQQGLNRERLGCPRTFAEMGCWGFHVTNSMTPHTISMYLVLRVFHWFLLGF